MEEKLHIGQGKVEVFLICDKSLGDCNAPFLAWLREEGFTFSGISRELWVLLGICKHYPKRICVWYARSSLSKPLGNHAITIDEFKTIYEIYKKYEGKDLFVFHSERFDYDKGIIDHPSHGESCCGSSGTGS